MFQSLLALASTTFPAIPHLFWRSSIAIGSWRGGERTHDRRARGFPTCPGIVKELSASCTPYMWHLKTLYLYSLPFHMRCKPSEEAESSVGSGANFEQLVNHIHIVSHVWYATAGCWHLINSQYSIFLLSIYITPSFAYIIIIQHTSLIKVILLQRISISSHFNQTASYIFNCVAHFNCIARQ